MLHLEHTQMEWERWECDQHRAEDMQEVTHKIKRWLKRVQTHLSPRDQTVKEAWSASWYFSNTLIMPPHWRQPVAGSIMFSCCLSHFCEHDTSWPTWGNFFKFGKNVKLDLMMNWLDFGDLLTSQEKGATKANSTSFNCLVSLGYSMIDKPLNLQTANNTIYYMKLTCLAMHHLENIYSIHVRGPERNMKEEMLWRSR